MTKLRIGVAGLGRIGWRFHLPAIAESDDFELAAVADTDAGRLAEAAATYGCRTYDKLESMCDGEQLDAVVIATPTHLHKPHALAAIERQCHIMLEKPAARTLKEAQAIGDAAQRARRVVTVYQPLRAKPWFQQALEVIRSGRIGEVYHARCGLFKYARRNDWQALRKFGGGMLNNYGAHALDQLLAITGYDVERLFCDLRRIATVGDAEDVVKVVYRTSAGVVGEADINQASPIRPYEFEAYGTRGVISKHDLEIHVRYLSSDLPPKQLDAALASAGRRYPRDDVEFAHDCIAVDERHKVDVYRDFAEAVRTGRPPFVTFDQALGLMRLLDRCRRSSGGIR